MTATDLDELLPLPTDPRVRELAALAYTIADRMSAEDGSDLMNRRAVRLGFLPDRCIGLELAVLMASRDLPRDPAALRKLARVKVRRPC